jgi:RNA polymerase sigma-70 factor (ECF subfamily)
MDAVRMDFGPTAGLDSVKEARPGPRPLPEETDLREPEDLARLVRCGDEAAEAELMQTFRRRIEIMIRARTRNPDVVADLVQETLMALLQAVRADRLHAADRLNAFAYGIARNVVNGFFRSRKRTGIEIPVLPETAASDFVDDVEAMDRQARVRKCLDSLAPIDREILTLTLVENLKPGEIAERVGLSAEVIRARKSRATKRVTEQLRPLSQVSGG